MHHNSTITCESSTQVEILVIFLSSAKSVFIISHRLRSVVVKPKHSRKAAPAQVNESFAWIK